MKKLADWMDTIVSAPTDDALIERTFAEVKELCTSFPAPGLSS